LVQDAAEKIDGIQSKVRLKYSLCEPVIAVSIIPPKPMNRTGGSSTKKNGLPDHTVTDSGFKYQAQGILPES
jgi:hypothetical protein